MPSRLLLLPLNHLLSRATWARTRLQAHTGQCCRISGPWLPPLLLQVDAEGLFTLAAADACSSGDALVGIDLPADVLPRVLAEGPAAVLATAHISGPAAFAETLGLVFRNLRWDAADDLAPLVGDVLAQRLTDTAKAVFVAKQEAWRRLQGNAGEFLTEESNPYLPLRREADGLRQGVATLGSEIDALTQRVQTLEQLG